MAQSEKQLNGAMGRVLRRFRSDLGLSQSEMALLVGLGSQTAVSNIEKGARPIQAAEVWTWSERIATQHPMSAEEIRREFFDSPFVTAWVARESNPEPTDFGTVAPRIRSVAA